MSDRLDEIRQRAEAATRRRQPVMNACGFCERGEITDPMTFMLVRSRAGFRYASRPCPYCDGTGLAPQGDNDD